MITLGAMTPISDEQSDPRWSGVMKVQTATMQVHDQLRELILSGEFRRGEQLPSEADLTKLFGVSRSTVREALRVLVSDQLITRKPGAGGGSFVSIPTTAHVTDVIRTNLSLLSHAKDVSPEELLEVRELLEGYAARVAALRKTEADVQGLRDCIVSDDSIGTGLQFELDDRYHRYIFKAAHNTLLEISTEPVFSVVQERFRRKDLSVAQLTKVNEEHKDILRAIDEGDPDAAEQAMQEHHATLRTFYPQLWA